MINETLYIEQKEPIHLHNCTSCISQQETRDKITKILEEDLNKKWHIDSSMPVFLHKNKVITSIFAEGIWKDDDVFAFMEKEKYHLYDHYVLDRKDKIFKIKDTEIYFDNENGSSIHSHYHLNSIKLLSEKNETQYIYFSIKKHKTTFHSHDYKTWTYPEILSLNFGSETINNPEKNTILFPQELLKTLCDHIGLSEHEKLSVIHDWKKKTINIFPILRECFMMQVFLRKVILHLENKDA